MKTELVVALSILLLALRTVVACEADDDCGKSQYCGNGQCLNIGLCNYNTDCMNPANAFGTDETCIGYKYCNNGQCRVNCDRRCPGGQQSISCLISECQFQECETAVSCVDVRCDFCQAVHFNAAGVAGCDAHLLPITTPTTTTTTTATTTSTTTTAAATAITTTTTTPSTTTITTKLTTTTATAAVVDSNSISSCSSNENCSIVEYCAGGECLRMAACRTVADCLNPFNEVTLVGCQGPVECSNGSCVRECKSYDCSDGSDYVQCLEQPCSAAPCIGSVGCIDQYCGGCNAFHFDAVGDRICVDSSVPFSELKTTVEEKKKMWEEQKMEQYTYTFQKSCLCPADGISYEIQVSNNVIMAVDGEPPVAISTSSSSTELPTIVGLFTMVEEAIEKRALGMFVTYDETFGYPVNFSIRDDETISATLQVDPTGAPSMHESGCFRRAMGLTCMLLLAIVSW